MKNSLPRSFDNLFTLSEKAADGLNAHESTIGIMHNTESVTRADLATARTANNAFHAARTGKLTATDEQTEADAEAVKFITSAREILKPILGTRYSQAWDEVGFSNQSLGVPRTISSRMELVKSLQLYFTSHPANEVAAINLTHTQAAARHDALSAAVSTVNACRADVRSKREARDTAVEGLRNRLRGLIGELTQLIGEDDPRWFDFGLKIPDDEQTPETPVDVVVTAGAPGHLVANWSDAPRAGRYRVFKQVVGVDDDFILAATVEDTDADMNTFASGAQVRVKVTAVNDVGESPASAVVEQVVP